MKILGILNDLRIFSIAERVLLLDPGKGCSRKRQALDIIDRYKYTQARAMQYFAWNNVHQLFMQ